jgi:hypothetical protein
MFNSITPTADYQYVDIDVCNNNLDNTAPKPLVFNQTKNTNIIDKASDYDVSVVRWMADSTLPVFIPEMETSQIDIPADRRTVYYFNFAIGTADAFNLNVISAVGENVLWDPQNFNPNLFPNYNVPVIKPKNQIEVLNNPYYYASSIHYVLQLFNLTLAKLYTRLMASYGSEFPNAIKPEFNWNPFTNSIDLLVSKEFTNKDFGPRIFITMNAPLYNLLNSFSCQTAYNINVANTTVNIKSTFNKDQLDTGLPFVMYTRYRYDLPIVTGPGGITVYQFIQESSSVPSWTPVSSIVFTSFSIPVIPSASGTPQFLGISPYPSNSQNAISGVVTDFEINMSIGTELANSVLQYQPSAEYRIISLNSDDPLRTLNFKVSWKSKWGTYHDFNLKYGGSASLKLMFRKRGLGKY